MNVPWAGLGQMRSVGLVPLDTNGQWVGGRYYLQHLVKAVAALPVRERLPMCDVWWQERAPEDPFAEVRDNLAASVVIQLPGSPLGRLERKIKRMLNRWSDARDLFLDAGIGALFPITPCENPGVPFVFWLSDFQYRHLPELFGPELCEWYERYFGENVRKADRVVVSSEHALRDLSEVFPEALGKARILRFCSIPDSSWYRFDPLQVAADKELGEKYFVLSNQFSHHKNHRTVFEAVRILKQRGVEVTVACTGSTYGFRGQDYFVELQDFIRLHRLESNVRILGMLPRDEQVAIMRGAIAMLQPSDFEGWSTVVEDAKTLGKMVLVSGIEVHREQLGSEHQLYLDGHDADAWASKMGEVWKTAAPGSNPVEESAALTLLERRCIEVGRNYVSIMNEVMGSSS